MLSAVCRLRFPLPPAPSIALARYRARRRRLRQRPPARLSAELWHRRNRTTGRRRRPAVGTWRRILYFLADDGSASSSETTWRFNADGTASRLSVTRNYTAGLADAQTVDARWEPLTQTVRITYLPPSTGTFEFSYRVTRDTLYLASQAYGRIAP